MRYSGNRPTAFAFAPMPEKQQGGHRPAEKRDELAPPHGRPPTSAALGNPLLDCQTLLFADATLSLQQRRDIGRATVVPMECTQQAREAVLSGPVLFFGIPLDFILFAATLLGVALFHRHTLAVALLRPWRHYRLQADLYRL